METLKTLIKILTLMKIFQADNKLSVPLPLTIILTFI